MNKHWPTTISSHHSTQVQAYLSTWRVALKWSISAQINCTLASYSLCCYHLHRQQVCFKQGGCRTHETDTAILSRPGGGVCSLFDHLSLCVTLCSHVRPLTYTLSRTDTARITDNTDAVITLKSNSSSNSGDQNGTNLSSNSEVALNLVGSSTAGGFEIVNVLLQAFSAYRKVRSFVLMTSRAGTLYTIMTQTYHTTTDWHHHLHRLPLWQVRF